MTDQEAHAQAFENGRQQGDKEGYERGLREALKHGRWEWLGPNRLIQECLCGTCSACKVRSKYIVNIAICPNCGARMDGGTNHDR